MEGKMSREIKFRAWDKERKCICKNNAVCNMDIEGNLNPQSNIYEIMQFTGLKDKKGKEIYEGDIIKWFADSIDKIGVIEWNEGTYVINRKDVDIIYGFGDFMFINNMILEGEVIGNIYENPELL